MPLRRLQLHDRVNIRAIKPMTDRDYTVRGCTALLDAIGGAIHHIGNVHKYARRSDVPEHTLFIITTDGMENASRFYSSHRVKQMIQRQKAKYGWEFLFLGANIDAVETAHRSAQIGSAGSTRTTKNEEKAKRDKPHEHEERGWRKPSFSLFVKLFETIHFRAAQLCAA